MSIYTKTGDKGETSLFGGERVSKAHDRVHVYGSIDELNSWIGLVASEIAVQEKKEFLHKIQSDLFIIGGFLAGWKHDLAVLPKRVSEMEVEIDAMEENLPELKHFILPGGSKLAATIHITRSICRRVERELVRLYEKENIDEKKHRILQYINRLSDFFFILARFMNRLHSIDDIPWKGIELNRTQTS
ncbi:MAG: cob(I)yrinic acid a,c-diamide adenosyltransferase [Patescibacteria group bacterium]|nr:cob(I)yrinic acid a,c-diamide adenosyltransferase [Patescibacteria group bacterium]